MSPCLDAFPFNRNGDICFRRGVQRLPQRVETQSKETMTDASFLPLQRLDANQVPPMKVEMLNAKYNGHRSSPDPHRKRINPFSDHRNPVNRPTSRNDFQNDVLNDDGRQRARTRSNRYDDVTIRDEDKRRTRTERSMKRMRSRERSPEVVKEKIDFSRDRKRSGRSDEKHSSRRNHVKDDDDVLRNERSKRARRHTTDRKSAEKVTHKNAERCDIKLEPNKIKKEKSSKRKSNEQPTSANNGIDALEQKLPKKSEEIATAFATKNHCENFELTDRPIQHFPVEAKEVEVVDPEVYDCGQMNATDNLKVASLDDNCDAEYGNADIESAEIEVLPKTETITAIPLIEILSQESNLNGTAEAGNVETKEAMEIDTIQTVPDDERMASGVLGDPVASVEKPISLHSANEENCTTDQMQTITKTDITIENGSNESNQSDRMPKIAPMSIITASMQQTENSENHETIPQEREENENEMIAADVENERISPNTSLSKSIKNVSTNSTDYQIVDEENEEIVIYVTRKKVKKPKKDKHKNKEKKAKKPTAANI